jgi:hypothetical protein
MRILFHPNLPALFRHLKRAIAQDNAQGISDFRF